MGLLKATPSPWGESDAQSEVNQRPAGPRHGERDTEPGGRHVGSWMQPCLKLPPRDAVT